MTAEEFQDWFEKTLARAIEENWDVLVGLAGPVTLDGICCVCHHKLGSHIYETGGWRCHAIGSDHLQCECWLRGLDDAFFGGEERSLEDYDLVRRMEKMNPKEHGYCPNCRTNTIFTRDEMGVYRCDECDWYDGKDVP